MKKEHIPLIALIITVIAGSFLFLISDTSGLGFTDMKLENTDAENPNLHEFSYILRSGRQFELLDIEYSLYTEDNQLLGRNRTIIKNITDGSYPQTVNITSNATCDNNNLKPTKVQVVVFGEMVDEDFKNANGTYSENILTNRTINFN